MKVMGYYPQTRDLYFEKKMYRRLTSLLWYEFNGGRYEYIQNSNQLEKEYKKTVKEEK
jgi:hypothetical protein